MSLHDWPILRQLRPDFRATVRIAFVFGQTGNNALIITGDDKVYGVGKNNSFCLGLLGVDGTLPCLNLNLSNKNVDGFSCGGDVSDGIFVIALLRSGELYQWGSLPMFIADLMDVPTPERVEFGVEVKVKAIACGLSHSMIVSDDGRVFTWGINNEEQLGLENYELEHIIHIDEIGSISPRQVGGAIKGKVVTEISCGATFSVVILEDGKVFSWGSNDKGQLGINNKDPTSKLPVAVSSLENVVIEKIACGPSHVLALSRTHELYVWGNNNFSQLGVPAPEEGSCYEMPVKCGGDLRFVDICASYACELSVAESESGEISMWGKLSSGDIITEPTDSRCDSIHQVFAFHASPNMMPKPMRHILKANRRSATLSKTFENAFGNKEHSDLTIVVDDRKIHVHRVILEMRSTYFRTMLSRWLNENQRVIVIREKSFAALEAYLKYLYTDKLDVNLQLAVELLQLGDEYADENFKLLCEQSIKRDVTADTVADLVALTRKLETCQDLNEFCLDYALKHAEKVIDSEGFKKWDVETMSSFTVYLVKRMKTDHSVRSC